MLIPNDVNNATCVYIIILTSLTTNHVISLITPCQCNFQFELINKCNLFYISEPEIVENQNVKSSRVRKAKQNILECQKRIKMLAI